MEMLVPAIDRRVELEAEMTRITLAFFESPSGLPNGGARSPGRSCS
jgi:hypothetical protein